MNPYKHVTDIKLRKLTNAQKELQKNFIQLNQKKEMYDISVKELCLHTKVARSTFYSYYNNVVELKEEIENQMVCSLIRLNQNVISLSTDEQIEGDFFLTTREYILENREAFQCFLISEPNISFLTKWKEAIKYHFWERLFKHRDQPNSQLILELIATQAITIFSFWLEHPEEVDTKRINQLFLETLKILE